MGMSVGVSVGPSEGDVVGYTDGYSVGASDELMGGNVEAVGTVDDSPGTGIAVGTPAGGVTGDVTGSAVGGTTGGVTGVDGVESEVQKSLLSLLANSAPVEITTPSSVTVYDPCP